MYQSICKTHPRIFPVKVHAIKTFVGYELRDVGCEGIRVVDNSTSQNVVGGSFRGIRPAAKRNDPLNIELLKVRPLTVRVIDDDFPGVRVDLRERPMHVGVRAVGVGVCCSKPKALAAHVVGLIVPNSLEACWSVRVDLDIVAAIGNASAQSFLGLGTWACIATGWMKITMITEDPAEAKIAATCVEWAGV